MTVLKMTLAIDADLTVSTTTSVSAVSVQAVWTVSTGTLALEVSVEADLTVSTGIWYLVTAGQNSRLFLL
jgi:hypothetical protein